MTGGGIVRGRRPGPGRVSALAAMVGRLEAPSHGPIDQDRRTVQRLRFGIGGIGLLLPPALPLGNWIFARFGHSTAILPGSMSGSYYTGTRNIFVGALCALGVFLIGYRFNPRDDLWSTVAGVFAICVAMCPTAPDAPTAYQSAIGYVHLGSAAILLLSLAMFCLVSFRDPGAADRRARNRGYLAAGLLILAFLVVAVVAGATHWGRGWTPTPLYACEALSVWAFGAAWIAAAFELREPAPAGAPLETPPPTRPTSATGVLS